MIRAQKEKVVKKLEEKFKNVSSVYLTDNTKMTVAQTQELRRRCREAGITVVYVKNRLLKQVIKDSSLDAVIKNLVGPTAVLYHRTNPVSIAKVIQKFNKDFDRLYFKIAYLDGQFFKTDALKDLAEVPAKEELIAKVLGALLAPITGVVSSLNAPMQKLVGTLDAIVKKEAA
jgi:large subunit ribosomal protein L10